MTYFPVFIALELANRIRVAALFMEKQQLLVETPLLYLTLFLFGHSTSTVTSPPTVTPFHLFIPALLCI
jgi:hypothetical protein